MADDLFKLTDPAPPPIRPAGNPVMDEIITPMVSVWGKPRTVKNEDLALGFYADDLGDYPRDVLRAAFLTVRRAWDRTYWPPVAMFRKECERLQGDFGAGGAVEQQTDLDIARRSWECANKFLAANNAVLMEAITGHFKRELEDWVRKEAARQLRDGVAEPEIEIPESVWVEFDALSRQRKESHAKFAREFFAPRAGRRTQARTIGGAARVVAEDPSVTVEDRARIRRDVDERERRRQASVAAAEREAENLGHAPDPEVNY